MVFLKLVHTEYQVNNETQPFWVKDVHLVPNLQTLAGRHAQLGTIWHHHCQITNEWINWKKFLVWIYYILITIFFLNKVFGILSF